MHGRNAAKLGGVLAATEQPSAPPDATGTCGICDRDLAVGEGDAIVEVELDPDGGAPEAWLCRGCYGYVVADLGITPTRVFKAGRHRSVVLPIGPGGRGTQSAGSD